MVLFTYLLADPKLLVSIGEKRRCNALHLAAAGGSKRKPAEQQSQAIKETLHFLVEEMEFNVNDDSNFSNKCPLHFACSNGSNAGVEFLLNQENILLDLIDCYHDGNSILHASCSTSNMEVLEIVLEKLKERGQLSDMLTLQNNNKQSPLDVAFTNGDLSMASKLLEFAINDEYASAKVDAQLLLNCSRGMETNVIIDFIKSNNLTFLAHRIDGATVLHLAAEKGWVRVAREIAVKNPSLLNEKDDHGCTPLHYAAAKNNWEVVDFLMNQ